MSEQFTSPTLELIASTEISVQDGRAINPACTPANINNLVREASAWLAEHPGESLPLPFIHTVHKSPDVDFERKFTHSYVRNTANRVPQVREAGRIKVTNLEGSEFGNGYLLSFFPGDFPKNRARDERMERAKSDAARKALSNMHRMIERFNPDLSFLADESTTTIQAALNVQAQYKALLDEILQRHEDGTL